VQQSKMLPSLPRASCHQQAHTTTANLLANGKQ